MNNLSRQLVAILLGIAGIALLWGGMSQTGLDSYLLYASGIVLIIDGLGFFLNTTWVKVFWWITLLGSAAYSLYYCILPFTESSDVSVSAAYISIHLAPLVIAAVIAYFLPQLLDEKK